MLTVVPVADPHDERLADYVGLSDPDLRRLRERSGGADGAFFICEGALVIRQLLRSAYTVRSLLVTPRRLDALRPALDGLSAPVFVADQAVVDAVSGFPLHRGALGSAERRPLPALADVAAARDLLVVAEGVNDHENLGALFRNAAAFGAAVVLDPSSADPLYRRSIRVSMGHVLAVPFTRVERWPQAVGEVRALGFAVLALTPGGDVDLRAVPPGGRAALVVGAEGPGLSPPVLAAADARVRVAMAAGVDSLNVATAAAVALHHLAGPP